MTEAATEERPRQTADPAGDANSNSAYAVGLMRAFGGAIIFAFPLLMTMEMWALGFYVDRWRLLVFLTVNLFVLVGLAHFAGFETTKGLRDTVMDALAAYGVGAIAAAAVLALFGIVGPGMPAGEVVGKIAIQAVPASIGAVVARKQLTAGEDRDQDEKERRAGYPGQLFLMLAGALFLAFNVAPTEEMVLIAFMMSPWHELAAVAASILLLHAFVYTVGFSGQEAPSPDAGPRTAFLHFTLPGYAIALAVSLYVLWTFGRTEGTAPAEIATMVIVLGFPASLGAAIARLIV